MQTRTISYAVRGAAALHADLYHPGTGTPPLLVAVHGGAWRRGERAQMRHWGEYLASNGIAVLAIDYRKSSDGPSYPANLEDVRDAWLFAQREAAALNIDPLHIGYLGASAGAHLAALAALTTDARATVLALVYGVYDLATHWRADQSSDDPDGDPTQAMMGATPDADAQRYLDASPQSQVNDAAGNLRALLVWGDADTVVLPTQSIGFAAALDAAGAYVATLPVADAGHFWFSRDAIDDPQGHTHAIAPALLQFLRSAFSA